MQPLTEILFEETYIAQQKYERFCALYGAKSNTSLMPLFQYESLHGVIERAGMVSEYTIYYKTKKKLRGTVCAG